MVLLAILAGLWLLAEADTRFGRPRFHWGSRLAEVLLDEDRIAVTLGRHVFVRGRRLSSEAIRHERVHVAQQWRYGLVLFFLLYGAYSLVYGYRDNPLEIEARTWYL